MDLQEIIGAITVLMAVALHIPYLIHSIQGKIKPHPVTWILWTFLTFVIFFAQFLDGAGPGSWGTGVVALICLGIAISSLKNGLSHIKKLDIWLFFIGLCSIPLWLITNDPTLSVVLVTTIDLIAIIPTFRKSWINPYDEPLYLYSLNVLRHGLSLFAIVNITIATVLFPCTIMLANLSLSVFLLWRRFKIVTP